MTSEPAFSEEKQCDYAHDCEVAEHNEADYKHPENPFQPPTSVSDRGGFARPRADRGGGELIDHMRHAGSGHCRVGFSGMPDVSPSPMLVHLDDALEDALADSEVTKLNAHDAEVAKTTSHHDLHRCFRCAQWAVDLVHRPEHSHLGHMVEKLRGVLHDADNAMWDVESKMFVSHTPELGVEITWVDDAVRVAEDAAAKSGWDLVPWEELLVELIAMEPPPAG